MEATRYFACVISKRYLENWQICKEIGMFGLSVNLKVLARIRPGDKLLTYFGGRGFSAISTITSPVLEPTQQSVTDLTNAHQWPDGGARPYRFSFSLDREYESSIPYTEVPALTSPMLQNAVLELSEAQYKVILGGLTGEDPDGRIVFTKDKKPVMPANSKDVKLPMPSPPVVIAGQEYILEPSESSSTLIPAVESTLHTKVQWQLIRLAEKAGCKAWIAKGDQSRTHNGTILGDFPNVLSSLPHLGMPERARGVVERIDVLWIKGNVIQCAFEIEHSTAVYSGILRLSDLVAVQPYNTIRLFILAPEERKKKVIQELNRPTFELLPHPLSIVCRYIGYSNLDDYFEKFKDLPSNSLQINILDGIAEQCIIGQDEPQ